MGPIRRLVFRFASLFRSDKAERELTREIGAHLQLLEDQFVAKGMTADEARYAAKRAFGGVEQAKELQRDARSFRWLSGWPMDLKLGFRMLVKSPGLTVIAVVALAVAIGGGAAYYEFTRDLLDPRLPFAGGDRMVGLQMWDARKAAPEPRAAALFPEWRDRLTTVEHVGARARFDRDLIDGDGQAGPARGAQITASIFDLIPTRPVLGRTLVADDERASAPPVVLIGHDLWQARFNGDPGIVGRTVQLGADAHTVVGVMPPGFAFPSTQNLWVPLKEPPAGLQPGEGPEIRIFGRLIEGVSMEAARAEAQAILSGSLSPSAKGSASARASAHKPALSADVREYFASLRSGDSDNRLQTIVLYAANLFFVGLLGICGANIATLVFARTATREAEITVRTALGASRARISAQLFAEALVLSSIAAFVGLMAASLGLERATHTFFTAAQGSPAPFWWDASLSAETIFYTAALAVLSALVVGVIPALKATGPRLQGRLREAGAGGSSLKFGRPWTGVVITQVAVTMIFLLSTAAIGWSALQGYHDFDVTFDRTRYLAARLHIDDKSRMKPAFDEIARRLMSEPGVVNVTYATRLPGKNHEEFWLEFSDPGVTADAKIPGDVLWTRSTRVGHHYFETFDIPLVAGRLFSAGEIESARPVAIVDETFVRLILGGRNAVGLLVREPPNEVSDTPGPWHEIVGVVKDVSLMSRKTTEDAFLYRPAAPGTRPLEYLVARTRDHAAPLASRLRLAAVQTDPALQLTDVMSMDRLADDDAAARRFFLAAFSVIAAVALLLSTAGIYALMSFTLARRRREIGIRMALGAAPRRIITGIFSRTFVQVGMGIAAGSIPSAAIIALGAGDASSGRGWLTGIAAALGIGLFIILVTLVACAGPLRKALRIEPTDALRAN